MKVFLSAPISSTDSEEYEEYNNSIIKLKKLILKLPSINRVFYAGDGMANKDDFDSPEAALNEDIGELMTSDYFLFIYPAALPTSAIFEAGVAFDNQKKLFFYTKKDVKLPYLFYGIKTAHIKEYTTLEGLFQDFKKYHNL